MPTFALLPSEIRNTILSYLPSHEILVLLRVEKIWRRHWTHLISRQLFYHRYPRYREIYPYPDRPHKFLHWVETRYSAIIAFSSDYKMQSKRLVLHLTTPDQVYAAYLGFFLIFRSFCRSNPRVRAFLQFHRPHDQPLSLEDVEAIGQSFYDTNKKTRCSIWIKKLKSTSLTQLYYVTPSLIATIRNVAHYFGFTLGLKYIK